MCDCMCRCVFRCVLWPFCLTLAQSLNGTWVFSNLSGNRPASYSHAIFGCLTLVQCERLTVNQGVALTAKSSCSNNSITYPPSVFAPLADCWNSRWEFLITFILIKTFAQSDTWYVETGHEVCLAANECDMTECSLGYLQTKEAF